MMTFSKVRLRDAMVSRRTFDLRARRVEWPVAAKDAEEEPHVGMFEEDPGLGHAGVGGVSRLNLDGVVITAVSLAGLLARGYSPPS